MAEHYNLEFGNYPSSNFYNIPEILPTETIEYPDRWVEFDYAHRNRNRKNCGVHFFERDYKFERVWATPNKYIPLINSYDIVCSPDFSMYANYPRVMQMWNLYRNCWCARFWQEKGATVIPSVMWGDEDSYDWCFSGMPKHSVVAVSNVGNMKGKANKEYFLRGYTAMLERLEPTEILMFTRDFKWNFEGNVHYIKWTMLKGEQAQ